MDVFPHRAAASRLIDWTGERCVPWAPDIPVVYEHFHRYLWAQPLVKGKRVLDLGSGEGFGSAILADGAASVVGIDIAEDAVEHAILNYQGGVLSFKVASATDLSAFPDDSFDVVVSFEVIEHVAEQDEVLKEIARVLTDEGLLIMSSPDRAAYQRASSEPNPFHERELSLPELEELIEKTFPHSRYFAQRTIEGSRIVALDGNFGGSSLPVQIELAGDEWQIVGPPAPKYYVLAASRTALPELPGTSTLADFGLQLMRSFEKQAILARADADALEHDKRALIAAVEHEKNEQQRLLAVLEERQAAWEQDRTELEAAWQQERTELEAAREAERATVATAHALAVAGHDSEQARQIETLTNEAVESVRKANDLQHELAAARGRLATQEASISWRLFQRFKGKAIKLLGGKGSIGFRSASKTLRVAHRIGASEKPEAPVTPIAQPSFLPFDLPTSDVPVASIVIPVHDGAEITERCLKALLGSIDDLPYEVIVVDDCADAATKALLASVGGLRVVVNETNLNFLHSVNRGAAEARGRHIVLLNNDTEPQPGWLRALVDRADSRDEIGVVAAKLIYPDGSLQEAGGIVWRDGTAWNFGRGDGSSEPQYSYVRSIDYGSAAALLVRRTVWDSLGGFDERFAPGYWEDTDLCFAARAAGSDVVYEPAAVVVHHEGQSMGTDTATGGKHNQVLNQPKFIEKWKAVLAAHPDRPHPNRAYLASNWRCSPTVLIVDHQIPEPDKDSGSLRMFTIIENLVEMGYRVVFAPDNGGLTEPYASALTGMGVQIVTSSFPQHVAALAPDLQLVILSRPYVASRYLHHIREHAPRATVAYDTVDLHFVREEGRAREAGRDGALLVDAFRHLELAMAAASDVTIVVSDDEGKKVQDLSGATTHVVPNANAVWADVLGPETRSGVIFIAGFTHHPNIDAAIELATVVMPIVWQSLPGLPLTIVGSNAPQSVRELAAADIDIAGWVQDVDPLLAEARVMAAPLRFGAGVKGKVTQALAAGLPVVTTPLGAEGLDAVDGEEILIADSPAEIAERIVELHRSDELWASISAGGLDVAERSCSVAAQRRALAGLLEGLSGRGSTRSVSSS